MLVCHEEVGRTQQTSELITGITSLKTLNKLP